MKRRLNDKMMKKKKFSILIITLILIFSLFSLAGCSFSKSKTEDTSSTEEESEDLEEDTETESEVFTIDMTPVENTEVETETQPKVCVCEEKCSEDNILDSCEVCQEDYTICEGEEVIVDPLDEIALPSGQTASVSIIAFGNNTIGNAVMNAAKNDTKYNFDYMYNKLQDKLSSYDVKMISQNSIFTFDASDYSGDYNKYQTPTSAGEALVNAGFNVITQASANSYVNGENGIKNTLNFWQQYPNVMVTGIYSDQESYDTISMADVNGIRIAFLNYTATINDTNLTNAEKYFIKTLSDETTVANEIQYASTIADFVIVSPSWGIINSSTPTENEKKWAQIFADNGADLIIGSGPTAVQPVELITSANGQVVPCYYSLGNCLAGATSINEILGGAAEITITKTGKTTTIESYDFEATITHISKKGDYYQTYMLSDYEETTNVNFHYFQTHNLKFTTEALDSQIENLIDIKDISNVQINSSGSGLTIVQPSQTNTNNTNNVNNEEETSTEEESSTEESISPGISNIQIIGG
jgi:poly-gamma-glutamate synthesis protein (capsule biosynthesis protein)